MSPVAEGPAERVHQIMRRALFADDEVLARDPAGRPILPMDAVLVESISTNWGLHPGRLAAERPAIEAIIREVVSDRFLKSKGGGASFLELCKDRRGEQWAEHRTMEALVVLAIALGLAGYVLPREDWTMFMGGLPYVWFADPE